MTDLFAAWTPLAVTTALIGGIGLGVVARAIHVDPRRFLFVAVAFLTLWYAPQVVRIEIDAHTTTSAVRTAGVGLLALVCYVTPAALIVRWRR